MSIGNRQQPEKELDSKLCKGWRRISRKGVKQMHNRKERHLARIDPEMPKLPKYAGWEW